MKVIRARILGYCMGVRRAMDMAEKTLKQRSGPGRVFAMGPLIHNPQAMDALKGQGLEVLDGDELPLDLSASTVIIRAHGITPQLELTLVNRKAHLVDATCPKVKASQLKARALHEEGYRIFLAGDRDHGEIIGIQGYAPHCILAANSTEAAEAAKKLLREDPEARTALIGQTTISPAEYRAIEERIRSFFPALELLDTICGATEARQDSLRSLCAEADAIVVAGGRSSANTRRLLAIARQEGKPAWLVESPAEIPPETRTFKTLGLCAGASTPESLIGAIEKALLKEGPEP
ncbi:4-hydroxy-3-methylbut-2-enyl diphosphate reductase [Treponema primitia ZAS-2]|uniref:4-hydroxy-3-methylbut-2-enyl diphosphate reductase n=1 Tax=Treponema primitia (strain ATCC BAA-887 / DSM 12427 / ZAS-2) TaxID=545694 RepID=F5YPF2_TREPZ|nr:4-hydroxy-3-methylbut-2-enyl diphosphate reductase [Treponema primitia]AEF84997.1 4-hydroxy-3-methylbut-2-enyl diphosphate reductase [Treponema primitia ZAS-2]